MAVAGGVVVIVRPCAEAFAYLADSRTHHEWQPKLMRTELVDDEPIGVGTRAVEVRHVFGREVRAPFVITRHEPPHRQDFHTTGGPVRPDGILRCEEVEGGTRVSYEFSLSGFSGPFLAAGLQRGIPGNLARVKRLLEAR